MQKVVAPLAIIALMAPGQSAIASENDGEDSPDHPAKVEIAVDTRFDFDLQNFSDSPDQSGFHGRYLNLHINGRINDQLSYSIRQRLNKFGDMKSDVFGATDWAYINYSPDDSWTLSGGKQVVAIGGYEYDRNPINIYYASMFWNNIACYQFGLSAAYHFADGRNTLLAQVCNSPYRPIGDNCYAYNLMWTGGYGIWHTIWSANIMEWADGHYGNIISLGNRFEGRGCYAELDFMNRYTGHQRFLFDDFSVIAKGCATFGRFDVFAKGGYEHYRPIPGAGATTDKPFYGAGVEYFPLKGSRNLRLHIVADVTHDGVTGERCTEFGAGVMWRVNLFSK